MPQSGSEGEPPEAISTGQRATFGLTPALSRWREREIWYIFHAMGKIRGDATVKGD